MGLIFSRFFSDLLLPAGTTVKDLTKQSTLVKIAIENGETEKSSFEKGFGKVFSKQVGNGADLPYPDEDEVAEWCRHPLLGAMATYSFDMFGLTRATGGNSLVALGVRIFREEGLTSRFGLDDALVARFWTRIQSGYVRSITYHTAEHGADVMQTMYAFMRQGDLMRGCGTDLDMLSAVVAAGVHDFQHPGVNNPFLVATRDPLAALYNDVSVLENHHISAAFGVLADPECNLLRNLTTAEYKEVRQTMVGMVLATDNAHHNHHISEFTAAIKAHNGAIPLDTLENRRLVLRLSLHAADVSGSCKPLSVSVEWSKRVVEEFFNQGDLERSLKMPISFLCDRTTTVVPESQIGFIGNFVIPLFATLSTSLKGSDKLLANANASKVFWEGELKTLQAAKDKSAKAKSSAAGEKDAAATTTTTTTTTNNKDSKKKKK